MSTLILLLLEQLALAPQVTRISEAQVDRAAVIQDSVLIQTPTGRIERAVLGAGLALDKTVTPWRIVALASPPPAVERIEKVSLARSGPGVYLLPANVARVVDLQRNGVGQTPGGGADYTLSGNIVTFSANNTDEGDVVCALVALR